MMCQLSDNYNYLTLVARRITKDKTKAMDLISETYITLHDRQSNVPVDGGFVKYFSMCMKNAHTNQRSSFNKINIKEVLRDYPNHIEVEDNSERMHSMIDSFKTSLPLHESILFELYYERGLSSRVIASMLTDIGEYKINYMCVHRLVEPIKLKLKTWRQLTLSDY